MKFPFTTFIQKLRCQFINSVNRPFFPHPCHILFPTLFFHNIRGLLISIFKITQTSPISLNQITYNKCLEPFLINITIWFLVYPFYTILIMSKIKYPYIAHLARSLDTFPSKVISGHTQTQQLVFNPAFFSFLTILLLVWKENGLVT